MPLMGLVSEAHDALMPAEYMTANQRFAARRPDVLVYETSALTEDVTVVGPVTANLFVSTSGTDSDWRVKLIDAYPSSIAEPVVYPDDQSESTMTALRARICSCTSDPIGWQRTDVAWSHLYIRALRVGRRNQTAAKSRSVERR